MKISNMLKKDMTNRWGNKGQNYEGERNIF